MTLPRISYRAGHVFEFILRVPSSLLSRERYVKFRPVVELGPLP
jgi:hypothetical protein